MKPALTREEWEHWEDSVNYSMYDQAHDDAVENLCANWGNPQQIAAKCLHGQPFGFTREDLRLLRYAARSWHPLEGRSHWVTLADRIEALLPPEEV